MQIISPRYLAFLLPEFPRSTPTRKNHYHLHSEPVQQMPSTQKKHYCRVVSSLPFRHASPFAPFKLILITLFTNIWFPENILTYCYPSLIVLLCYCSNYGEPIFSWKWKFRRLFLAFLVRVCLKALKSNSNSFQAPSLYFCESGSFSPQTLWRFFVSTPIVLPPTDICCSA